MASTITIKFTNPPKDGKADGLEVHLSEAAKSVDWAKEGTQFPNVMGIATSKIRFNGVPVLAGSFAKYAFGTAGNHPKVVKANWMAGAAPHGVAKHEP